MTTAELEDVVLPESVQALLHPPGEGGQATEETLEHKIGALTQLLLDDRKRCITGRTVSGIEEVWRKCDDNYATIDEVTGQQSAVVRPRFHKPLTMDGPLRSDSERTKQSNRSTAFERLTARYVDAAKAKVCAILLTNNAKSFGLKETPNPDLIKAKEDLTQVVEGGVPLQRDQKPEEYLPPNPTDPLTPPQPNPAQPPSSMPGVPLTNKDLAEEKINQAHSKAKKAETIIFDWMKEGKYVREMRKVLHNAPKLGTGILKAPIPVMRKAKAVSRLAEGKIALQVKEALKPGFQSVSPWDFFPDPDCGEDIHAGSGVWERDHNSERQLESFAVLPGYFKRAIAKVIAEGPGAKELAGEADDTVIRDTRFETWHHTGWLTKEQVAAVNLHMELPPKSPALLPEDHDAVSVVVTLVNNSMIRCTINSLEKTGHFPYHVIPWTPRAGSWAGVGVGEQVFMPQELINAATREMVNNASVSAGSQIVMHREMIVPAQKDDWTIYGDKLWFMKNDAMVNDVKQVFGVFAIPNCTPQMLTIITHAYLVAENSCNIPLISQGQSGDSTPETLGQTELQDSNANQLLRDVASNVDDCIVEPVVEDLYEWLLLDPEIDDDAKGDFQIDASGSSALMARAIQSQFLAQQGGIVKDPAFGCNPKKWYAEVLKNQHLNPADIQYTEEESAKLAQVPPPKAPQVAVAEIRASVDLQKAQLDTDRDTAYVQAETDQTRVQHEAKVLELQLKRELAMLEYANRHQINLEQLKTELATTTMKLQVQKELSAAANAVDVHKHATPQAETPPTEPAGRAKTGESFEQ